MNIDENDNRLDAEIARSVTKLFRLSDLRATVIIDEMKEVVSGWRTEAEKLKLSGQKWS